MKKDSARDYIIEAFRLYSRLGEPEAEKVREKIYLYSITSRRKSEVSSGTGHISKPTEAAAINADKTLRHYRSELMDIDAACKTVEALGKKYRGYDAAQVLRDIYFKNAHLPLKKADIQSRVTSASIKNHISESTAYRILKSAREIFAYHRGLTIPNDAYASLEEIVS
ncbi:MAG: hypothetical protein IKC41_03260 [Clostridia bacterium]|nr:hypothetical protein [Clostridia bacterium]MBR2877840.1 hypothetical protein [Clostridia bacterium]MBR2973214.1 hypothetical protein [Clostridia bacterium]MBR3575981.1 hypothetical protein [Clostridia bacterium]